MNTKDCVPEFWISTKNAWLVTFYTCYFIYGDYTAWEITPLWGWRKQ